MRTHVHALSCIRTCAVGAKPCLSAHRRCSFPFEYSGYEYYECTATNDENPWCAASNGRARRSAVRLRVAPA